MVNNKLMKLVGQMRTNKNLLTQYYCEIVVPIALLSKLPTT